MKKNYYKLFADYCRKNKIWFEVCADGWVGYCMDTKNQIDFGHSLGKFGTAQTYNEMVKEHKRLLAEK